jgi:transcriptional regulator with XRE-family HTH domain
MTPITTRPPRTPPPTHPAIKGQALREARLDRRMTLVAVCEACAALNPLVTLHSSGLSRYERGEVNPSPQRLRVIAQVLGKTPQDFLVQEDVAA